MGVGRRNQGLLVKVRNWPRGRSCGLDVLAYGAFARQSGTTRPVYEELAHLLRQLRLKAWLEDQGQTTGEAELQGQEMLGRLQPSSGVGRRRGQERWDDDDPSLPEPARYLAALSAGRGAFPIFGGVRWPEGGCPAVASGFGGGGSGSGPGCGKCWWWPTTSR